MKIQGWSVERFGALRNYEVRDLPDGLTVFYGPNGAGKSTLVAFIRQMLFGSLRAETDGRRGFAQGGWAGRLDCSGSGSTYTIAQKSDRPSTITRHDGGDAGPAGLDYLFGGPDARTIGSLLTFDITDLQTFPLLASPAIRDRIFPPGAARNLRTIQRAVDAIQIRKSEIAQRGNAERQKQSTAPVELQSRIERSTRAAARIGQLVQAHAQAQLTFDHRSRAITDLKADSAKYDALTDLAPMWQELTQARRELDGLDPIDQFPTDPERRLEQALAARQAAERTVAQLAGQESLRGEGSVAPSDGGHEPSSAGDGRFSAVVRQPVRLQDSLDAGQEDSTGWQRRLKEAMDAVRESERRFEATSRAVRELETTRAEVSATLNRPEPPNILTLDEEARLVQQVRTTLAGLASDQSFTKRWQDQIAERSATIRILETDIAAIPSNFLSYMGWLAAILGSAGSVWRGVEHDIPGFAILAGSAILCAIGSTVQGSRRTKALDDEATRRDQLGSAREELERACQNLLHHQERASRRRFDISVDSVRLGLPPMPTDLQLKEREAELEAQRRQRAEWDRAHSSLTENLSTLAKNEELRRQHAQALMAAQGHERQTVQQWNQWKVHAGLAEVATTTRSGGEAVRTESELLETCRQLRSQIAEWEHNATEWNTRARAALVGIAPEPERSREAESARSGGVMVAQAPTATEQSPALQAGRRRLRQCEDALTQLFSQAGVADETAFRARLGAYRRRTALTQAIRSCEARFSERLRREPSPDLIKRELAEGHVEEWRQRATRSNAELSNLESSRDEAMRQLRQLDAEISAAMAESSELPALEAERSGLAAEALATARASRTLAVAGSLLEDARRHLERESQGPALRRASEALAAITLSRYERLAASEDQRELVVLDTRNGWMPVNQLSRGTAEQLYFSLRIGFAEESAQRGSRLPIVIDDVLDHFDPKRSQAMARQIVELSRSHQVFVFTRRPETSDMLRHMDPSAKLMTMQEL